MKSQSTILWMAVAGLLGFGVAFTTGSFNAAEKESRSKSSAATASTIIRDPGAEALSRIGTVLATHADLAAIASLPTLLDSLDDTQLGTLLESVDRLSLDQRSRWLPRIMAYWTRRDRAAATRWLEPRLEHLGRKSLFGVDGLFSDGDSAMLIAWADNAPQEAVEAARRHMGGRVEEVLLGYVLTAEPSHDPAKVFKLLQGFTPGHARRSAMAQVFAFWAGNDPAGSLAAAASLPPGLERDAGVSTALRKLAEKGPARALEQAETLQLTDPKVLASTFARATEADPVLAAQWLDRQDERLAPLQTVLVSSWATRDPAAAFTWAQAHGLDVTETSLRLVLDMAATGWALGSSEIRAGSPIQAALTSKPEEALRWISENMPAERDSFLQMATSPALEKLRKQFGELSSESAERLAPAIVGDLMRQDREQAQGWAAALPAGPAREQAWSTIGAIGPDLLPLPPGSDRDAMISGMATHLATSDPVKALNAAAEITDEKVRRRVMDDVFWLLGRGPTYMQGGVFSVRASAKTLAEAAAWVERAAVPEEWKRGWSAGK